MAVEYRYDGFGRLVSIPNILAAVDYDERGRRIEERFANGVTTAYTYHPTTLRLASLTTSDPAAAVLSDFGYTYDAIGNLVSVTSPDPGSAASYTYDELHRLRSAVHGDGVVSTYDYDPLGNLTAKSDVGTYSYDPVGLLTQAGSDGYQHDAAGRVISAGDSTYTYDVGGRVRRIERPGITVDLDFDHAGRRARTVVREDGGTVVQDTGLPDAWLAVDGGELHALVYEGSRLIAQIRLSTRAPAFFHGDHLGSVALVTATDGSILQRRRYDPFGRIVAEQLAPGAIPTERGYLGQRELRVGALIDLNARLYDPRLGRFLTPDRVVRAPALPTSWNRYAYALDNPLRFADPSGHFFEEIGDWFEENWQAIVAVIAIVAIAVLTVVTFGAAALIVVGIGMAIGGVVGGLAASAAGGDVLTGVLVGMAVGGAAAYAGLGLGALTPGLASSLGGGTFGKVAAGALIGGLKGAVVGAAMGFAAGYAGGAGDAETIFDRMWRGALVGFVVGFVVGGVGAYLRDNPAGGPYGKPSAERASDYLRSGSEGTPQPAEVPGGTPTPPSPGDAGGALGKVGVGTLDAAFTNPNGFYISNIFFSSTTLPITEVVLTAGISGLVVLDYAEDFWEWLVGTGFVEYSKDGKI
jgi:RHS repeat-associated protein